MFSAAVARPAPPTYEPLLPPISTLPAYLDTWAFISSIYHHSTDLDACERAYESLKNHDVDFYLPQLCLMLVHIRSASNVVERLVLDRCASSLHFTVRSMFFLGALGPTSDENPILAERIENYRYACQLAYINSSRPALESDANPVETSHSTAQSTESTSGAETLTTKDIRFKYLWSVKRFMRELADLGEIGGHVTELRPKLAELNEQLRRSVLERESSRYLPGLFLPLGSSKESHYAILKLPEHEVSVLASKNRFPFHLCLETLSLPSSPTISDSGLENLIDSYTSDIEQLLLSGNGRERRFASTSSSSVSSLSSSPVISPTSSIDDLQPNQRSTRSPSPLVPLSKSVEFASSTPPPANLQHLLSVPQNSKSIRMKEKWPSKESRIREHSVYGPHEGWRLRSVIVKYGLDGLQEQLALQILKLISMIFETTPNIRAKCLTYDCQVIDGGACIVDPLLDAESIHQIKKHNNQISLYDYFVKKWNGPNSEEFLAAQREFMVTLCGSSLASYVLQLKDRHNANIMINDRGSVAHIDWGFLLWNTPGALGFESAPFKLTAEMVSVLGGPDSPLFSEFKSAFHEGFMLLRKHALQIVDMVSMMFLCDEKRVPCAAGGAAAIDALKSRLALTSSNQECLEFTESLITQSYNNWRTLNYDYFQYYTNGILS